jgi:putative oxidoreductase
MTRLDTWKPLALLLLRFALGIIFMAHGYPKLFTQTAWFLQYFQRVGMPPHAVYFVGALELFGGGLLILGLGTRVVALFLAGEMAVVIWKVKLVHGIYSVQNYELELALAAGAFLLFALGAGMISADYPLFERGSRPRSKPEK